MKKLFILLPLLFISFLSLAQWPKVYGHDTYDAIGRGITTTYDKGIGIAGSERLEENGSLIGYLRKIDINGSELWKRYFTVDADLYSSTIVGISEGNDGSYLLTGQTLLPNNESNGYAIKVNACGEKVWCNIFDIPGYSLCFDNKQLADGGYIILACYANYTYDRIWLYRLDAEGNLLWQKCMDPDTNYFDETGYNLLLTNDSCVLVTGFNYYIREPGSGLGWFSPLWVKFDLEGNQLWDLTWYGNGFIHGDFGRTIQDAGGNYFMAGADGFQEPGMKASFYKFTREGIPVKLVNVYDQGTASGAKSITFYQDSTLFIGGGYAIGNTGYSMVIKCDTTGNVIKTKDVPLYGFPVAYSALTTDNKVFALGERYLNSSSHWETCLFKFNQNLEYDSTYTVPRTYDSLCPYAVTPTATINLDCITVDTEEPIKKPEGSRLKVYPLPATGIVTIALPEYYVMEENKFHIKTTTTYFQLNGAKTIEIVNLLGQKTATYNLADGQTSVDFDVSNWAPGMYLARLICKGKVWAQGNVMVGR